MSLQRATNQLQRLAFLLNSLGKTMQTQLIDFNTLDTTELSLQQVVHRVLNSGRITTAERIWFHRMIMADLTLSPETMQQVRRLFDRLQMGLIKVVD